MSQWAGRFRILLLVNVVVSFMAFSQELLTEKPNIPSGLNPEYAGTQACIDCHQNEVEAWKGSHHDMAMKHANTTSVRGDFDNHVVTHKGMPIVFLKKRRRILGQYSRC